MIERFLRPSPRVRALPQLWAQQALFWGGAVAVALTAIFFARTSSLGNEIFVGIVRAFPWLAFFLVPAGFALIVWLTRRFFTGAEGSGIPQTIAALGAIEIAGRSP